MKNTKLLKIINQVLENAGNAEIEVLTTNTDLRKDLDLDSISMAELIVTIDDAFGVDINAQGMIQTIGDIQHRLAEQNNG
jgi:acyl carrier protein